MWDKLFKIMPQAEYTLKNMRRKAAYGKNYPGKKLLNVFKYDAKGKKIMQLHATKGWRVYRP